MVGAGNGIFSCMLGERNEPLYLRPFGSQEPSPRSFAPLTGETDLRSRNPHKDPFAPLTGDRRPKAKRRTSRLRAGPRPSTASRQTLLRLWTEDGVLEGETAFGAGMLPAEYAAGITLMELTVHGWDLAKATGQELVLDPATAELAAQVTAQAAAGGKDTGLFGPPVDAPEHFDEFQKSLATLGARAGLGNRLFPSTEVRWGFQAVYAAGRSLGPQL